MKYIFIFNIVLRLFLGGMMLYGGYQKFAKPIPQPTDMVEKIKANEAEMTKDVATLKIRNYIFGMKQTNFFWQFLGLSEILVGLLLLSQVMGFVGAIVAMPLTINIFLFHLFLEPNEVGELVETGLLLLANIWLIAFEYKRWKPLVFNKVWE